MSRHEDPAFWSAIMRESSVAVYQVARDATTSGEFDPAVVNVAMNKVLARYDSVEEQAAVMTIWAQSAIGSLATTMNHLAKQQGFSSWDDLQTQITAKEILDDL